MGLKATVDGVIAPDPAIIEDVFHYAVHLGIAYDLWNIGTTGDRILVFKTPDGNTRIHLLWKFSCEVNALFKIYRDVTPAPVMGDIASVNANDESTNICGIKAGHSETVGKAQSQQAWTGGEIVYAEFSSRRGGSGNAEGERFLAPDTWYGVILDQLGSGDIGMTLRLFEVPNA